MTNMWDYRDDVHQADRDVVGYEVMATDGSIGKIDEASMEAGSAYLVVDTGFWIFGKKRMIPARVVQRVDDAEQLVHVSMSKDDIKSAPDFDDQHRGVSNDAGLRAPYDIYYGPFGPQ
jgi:hypothetical protein